MMDPKLEELLNSVNSIGDYLKSISKKLSQLKNEIDLNISSQDIRESVEDLAYRSKHLTAPGILKSSEDVYFYKYASSWGMVLSETTTTFHVKYITNVKSYNLVHTAPHGNTSTNMIPIKKATSKKERVFLKGSYVKSTKAVAEMLFGHDKDARALANVYLDNLENENENG